MHCKVVGDVNECSRESDIAGTTSTLCPERPDVSTRQVASPSASLVEAGDASILTERNPLLAVDIDPSPPTPFTSTLLEGMSNMKPPTEAAIERALEILMASWNEENEYRLPK